MKKVESMSLKRIEAIADKMYRSTIKNDSAHYIGYRAGLNGLVREIHSHARMEEHVLKILLDNE